MNLALWSHHWICHIQSADSQTHRTSFQQIVRWLSCDVHLLRNSEVFAGYFVTLFTVINRGSKSSFPKNGKWAVMIGQSWRTEVAAHLSRRSWGRNRCVTSSECLRRRILPPSPMRGCILRSLFPALKIFTLKKRGGCKQSNKQSTGSDNWAMLTWFMTFS